MVRVSRAGAIYVKEINTNLHQLQSLRPYLFNYNLLLLLLLVMMESSLFNRRETPKFYIVFFNIIYYL